MAANEFLKNFSQKTEIFCLHLGKALWSCQSLEGILKLYILKYIEIIQTSELNIPLNIPSKKIKKATLGKLINFFEAVNENEKLIFSLKDFNGKRNSIAHDISEEFLPNLEDTKARELQKRLQTIEDKGRLLAGKTLLEIELLKEKNNISSNVYPAKEDLKTLQMLWDKNNDSQQAG